LEEYALYRDCENFHQYSKQTEKSVKGGIVLVTGDTVTRLWEVSTDDPSPFTGLFDMVDADGLIKPAHRARQVVATILTATPYPFKPAASREPPHYLIKIIMKGVGDNRPLVSRDDPIILRLESDGYDMEVSRERAPNTTCIYTPLPFVHACA